MLKENAFRHQILLEQQQVIYDYWLSKCEQDRLPSREQINPCELSEYLPTISFIQPCQDNAELRYRYRLAGTGFWQFFDSEITGQFMDELPLGHQQIYWRRILNRLIENGRPSAGVTRPETPRGRHMAQFWIRLPLSSNGRDINMILGFDKFITLSKVEARLSNDLKIYV